MLLRRLFRRPLNQLFVSAALALPGRKDCAGISGILVNGVLGGNDLSPALRARAPPSRPLFNVDILELALVFHELNSKVPNSDPASAARFAYWMSALQPSRFAMTISQNKYCAKDRNRRHQQNQRANVQVASEVAIPTQRRATHHTLGQRRFAKPDRY